MNHRVKCLFVNALNKQITEVYQDIPEDFSSRDRDAYSHGQIIHIDPKSETGPEILLWYNQPDAYSGTGLDTHGFLWARWDDYENRPLEDSHVDAAGNGLLVAYRREKGGKNNCGRRIPIDIPWSVETAKGRIVEWTNGILRKVPEFTCMLSEKFDDPGTYELLLRLENRDLLDYEYEIKLDKPIQQWSPQVISFSLEYHDITIIIGRIKQIDDKIRVMIFRTDHSDLKLIDATTLTANKIPQWVKARLETFFKYEFIDKRIAEGAHRYGRSKAVMVAPASSETASV